MKQKKQVLSTLRMRIVPTHIENATMSFGAIFSSFFETLSTN